MVKSTGAAGLERIELKQLAERVGKLYSVLREAAEAELTPLAAFKPPTDVCETADAVCIRIELPGVAANQIKIALTSDKLRVYGEKRKRNPRQKTLRFVWQYVVSRDLIRMRRRHLSWPRSHVNAGRQQCPGFPQSWSNTKRTACRACLCLAQVCHLDQRRRQSARQKKC